MKSFTLRISDILLLKYHYVVAYERRSVNQQLNLVIHRAVRRFEAEHGEITADDLEKLQYGEKNVISSLPFCPCRFTGTIPYRPYRLNVKTPPKGISFRGSFYASLRQRLFQLFDAGADALERLVLAENFR